MKTHKITLKKKILLVEIPGGARMFDTCYYEDNDETEIGFYGYEGRICGLLRIGKLESLGKLSDLQDSDVENLVESYKFGNAVVYKDYNFNGGSDFRDVFEASYKHPMNSFMSALESEVHWENTIPEPEGFKTENGWCVDDSWIRDYDEAESRTFDKSRTLIFVEK